MPAVLETDGAGEFVVKFRGAGQGAKALTAEIIVGLLAAELGLPVPELALVQLDESFGRSEPDPEIQDILKGSRGLNVGMRYLPGAYNFDPLAVPDVDPALAARIVWLDAFVTNIDRTPRNPNMLYWERQLWLIDHGAALYVHHNWATLTDEKVRAPFVPIRDHVLLPVAGDIMEADGAMRDMVSDELLTGILASVPDELLMDAPAGTTPAFPSAAENRDAYCRYLTGRLNEPRAFAEEAERARRARGEEKPVQQQYRR